MVFNAEEGRKGLAEASRGVEAVKKEMLNVCERMVRVSRGMQ